MAKARALLVPLAGYLALAALFLHPLVGGFRSRILADDAFIRPGQSDAYNFLWTYWWGEEALGSGHSLLFCDWVLPPTGADLHFHTHVILPTVLTTPIAKTLGPVAGYNAMILLLFAGAALALYLFLRRTLELSAVASFFGGAAFGFAPYFVFKAHAHVNLVGGAFWGAALALLVSAFVRRDFGWKRGAAFALFVWATFWTSLVELTMLALVGAATFAVFAVAAAVRREPIAWRRVPLFFAPSLLGAPSLLAFSGSGAADTVKMPLFVPLEAVDLFRAPKLGILSGLGTGTTFEYWGVYLPIALLVPAAYAAFALLRARDRLGAALAAIAVVCLVLVLDPWRGPSTVIRALPMGEGFRVFGRFFPFFLFFVAILAAIGVDRAMRAMRSRAARIAASCAVFAVAAVELFPVHASASPVARFGASGLDRTRRMYVVPHGPYLNVHDTYQVAFDQPAVVLSYLAREAADRAEARARAFPRAYAPFPKPIDDPALLRELAELDVAYLVFEDEADLPPGLPGALAARDGKQLVWRLER